MEEKGTIMAASSLRETIGNMGQRLSSRSNGSVDSARAGYRRERANESRHLPRLVVPVILFLIGISALIGAGGSAGTPHAPTASAPPARAPHTQAHQRWSGAATREAQGSAPTTPQPTFCLPTDLTCLLNQAAQWLAQAIFSVVRPIVDAIDQNSLNFITQTPPSGTYQNATVMQFTAWSIAVADTAVALLIVIGGYNIMIARQIGVGSYGIMEFLPRIALAVMAANLSLSFIQFFIDLENALCLGVTDLLGLTFLTNTIVGIFQGNLVGAGLLVFVLAMVLGVLNIMLAGQMLLRLALLVLLIALAPLALLCWGLPQTQGYARLWTTTFAATVFVQFFQVAALALGAMLVSYASTARLLTLDSVTLSLLISAAVLYLALRIPGMMRVYAFRPMAEAGTSTVRAAQDTVAYAAGTAARMIALL
jgi:hypothetical protein